jgi:hypothetical protein
MKTNLFQGYNVSKLPLTHTGSIYLMPESNSILGLEKFVVNWCRSIGVVDFLAGTLEKGKFKGLSHLQWVAVADESLPQATKEFMGANSFEYYYDEKLVKSASEKTVSGFQDKYHMVKGVKIKGQNTVISIEPIVDKISASKYAFKSASWGVNTVYYPK